MAGRFTHLCILLPWLLAAVACAADLGAGELGLGGVIEDGSGAPARVVPDRSDASVADAGHLVATPSVAPRPWSARRSGLPEPPEQLEPEPRPGALEPVGPGPDPCGGRWAAPTGQGW